MSNFFTVLQSNLDETLNCYTVEDTSFSISLNTYAPISRTYNILFFNLLLCICQILSVEEAERVREQSGVCGLDEYNLRRLEADLRDLGMLIKTASPLVNKYTPLILFLFVSLWCALWFLPYFFANISFSLSCCTHFNLSTKYYPHLPICCRFDGCIISNNH